MDRVKISENLDGLCQPSIYVYNDVYGSNRGFFLWKIFLRELLKPIGRKFLLHCNFEVFKLNISLPSFYRQCLVAWSELNANEPSSVHEIANQVIWNNKFLCVDKKSVYRRDIADQGFCKIWDLFSVDNV